MIRNYKLTKKQKQVFDFIIYHIKVNHNFPTCKEISVYFGFKSSNAAKEHLRMLSAKGFIEKLESSNSYRVKNIEVSIEFK